MLTALRVLVGVGVFVLATLPTPASAQERGFIPLPVAEVSAGYTFLRDYEDVEPGTSGTNLPAGWFTSGAYNVNHWMGLVGEATGSYKNGAWSRSEGGVDASADIRAYTVMGGPRVYYKRGRFVPFAQVLAGAAHHRGTVNASGFIGGAAYRHKETETRTDFAIQPGGGITVYLAESLGVRVGADYRAVFMTQDGDTNRQNQFRFLTGLMFGWGRR